MYSDRTAVVGGGEKFIVVMGPLWTGNGAMSNLAALSLGCNDRPTGQETARVEVGGSVSGLQGCTDFIWSIHSSSGLVGRRNTQGLFP